MRRMVFSILVSAGIVLSFCKSAAGFDASAIGIKGGLSLANFWGDGSGALNDQLAARLPAVDERNHFWGMASLFRSTTLLPDLAATQTEIVYYRAGKSWETEVAGESTTFSAQIDYLQFPMLLKITFPVPVIVTSAYAGPHLSLALRARADDLPPQLQTVPLFSGTDLDAEIMESIVNTVNVGITAGAELRLDAGPGGFLVDLRFIADFLNTFNIAAGNQIRNFAFAVMVGYVLDIGGAL